MRLVRTFMGDVGLDFSDKEAVDRVLAVCRMRAARLDLNAPR